MKTLSDMPKKFVTIGAIIVLAIFIPSIGTQALSGVTLLMVGNFEESLLLIVGLMPLAIIFMNRVYPGKTIPLPIAAVQLGFLFVNGIAITDVAMTAVLPPFLIIGLVVWFGVLALLALGRLVYNIAKLPSQTRKRYLIGFGVACALAVAAPLFFEVQAKNDLSKVNNMVQLLADSKLKDAGATELTQNAEYRKDGIIGRARCNFEQPCPSVHREWLVLMDRSRLARQSFVESMLKSQGYDYRMLGFGEYDDDVATAMKDGVGMRIAIKQPGDVKLPTAAPDKKVWRTVVISTGGGGVWGGYTKEKLAMTPYTSKYKSYSFAYPKGWKVEDRSTPEKDEIIITSADGKLGRQISPEPKAESGQVLRIIVTPCSGGKECSLDGGVYTYPYDHSIHGPEIELDDGTKAANLSFQYLGEEGTDYTIFFRNGKKYVLTYNVAGKSAGDVSQGFNSIVNNSFHDSFTFAD